MRRLALLAALLAPPAALAQTPTVFDDPALAARYQATITPAELAGHLYVYASDYLAGRDTGEPGQRFAALYLAGQYQTMGLAPKGTVADSNYGIRSYLQPFLLERSALQRLTVTATRDGTSILSSTLTPDEPEAPTLIRVGGGVFDSPGSSRLVYAGYGDGDLPDAEGAIVLLRRPLPIQASDREAVDAIITRLGEAGATAVVIPFAETISSLGRMAAGAVRARLRLPTANDEASAGPALFLTGEDIAAQLVGPLDAAPMGDTGVELSIVEDRQTTPIETENVVAFIEGSDPALREEVVVLSAHLDHVGTRPVEAGEDGIYNGADDDGSGTVALLEIAEAFQQAVDDGHGPRRSLLFLHVTGEEKGLFGSAYYADTEPLVPLDNTVANLNIDMIGRHDPTYEGAARYIDIIGAELISADLDAVNTRVNEVTGLSLELSKRFNSPDDPNQFFRRSDHWNFGKHDVPFIFYFNGTHDDYHGVDDEPERIDYDLLALRTRLIFGTAWQLANQDARPAVSGTGFN